MLIEFTWQTTLLKMQKLGINRKYMFMWGCIPVLQENYITRMQKSRFLTVTTCSLPVCSIYYIFVMVDQTELCFSVI